MKGVNRIMKKALSFLLALATCLTLITIPAHANTEWKKFEASDWAQPELQKADALALIPDALKDKDLTKPITRAEFAAVGVKVFENMTGKTAAPISPNPFSDTGDADVLKAYNIGLVNGTSDTTFSPNDLLTREQAATLLTRVLKAAYIPGWTLQTDSNYTLNFTQPNKFADDDKISGYAKQSVYFMASNGIIGGVGGNMFSPRATTAEEQAANYATATREAAVIIGVRLVDNLKDKLVNYSLSGSDAAKPSPLDGGDLTGEEFGMAGPPVAFKREKVAGIDPEWPWADVEIGWKGYGDNKKWPSYADVAPWRTEIYEDLMPSPEPTPAQPEPSKPPVNTNTDKFTVEPDKNMPYVNNASWPAAYLPADTPKYPGGTFETDAAPGDIFIYINNTSSDSLYKYLEMLVAAGWKIELDYFDPSSGFCMGGAGLWFFQCMLNSESSAIIQFGYDEWFM